LAQGEVPAGAGTRFPLPSWPAEPNASQQDHGLGGPRKLGQHSLPGLDVQLFVLRYQLEFPNKDDLERFLAAQASSLGVDRERRVRTLAGETRDGFDDAEGESRSDFPARTNERVTTR